MFPHFVRAASMGRCPAGGISENRRCWQAEAQQAGGEQCLAHDILLDSRSESQDATARLNRWRQLVQPPASQRPTSIRRQLGFAPHRDVIIVIVIVIFVVIFDIFVIVIVIVIVIVEVLILVVFKLFVVQILIVFGTTGHLRRPHKATGRFKLSAVEFASFRLSVLRIHISSFLLGRQDERTARR
jgi:hypothetical protein